MRNPQLSAKKAHPAIADERWRSAATTGLMILVSLAATLWSVLAVNTNPLEQVPYNLHSLLQADYSAEEHAFLLPGLKIDIIADFLRDQGGQENPGVVATLRAILQTPVPSVTPPLKGSGGPLSTPEPQNSPGASPTPRPDSATSTPLAASLTPATTRAPLTPTVTVARGTPTPTKLAATRTAVSTPTQKPRIVPTSTPTIRPTRPPAKPTRRPVEPTKPPSKPTDPPARPTNPPRPTDPPEPKPTKRPPDNYPPPDPPDPYP